MKIGAMLFVGMLAAGGCGASFYVSKSGNNTTGASWAAAWNELNQINWTNINPTVFSRHFADAIKMPRCPL